MFDNKAKFVLNYKVDFQPLILTALICTSYLGFTQFNTVNIAVNSCFDKDSTELIQEYVLVEELVLTNPNLDCLGETQKDLSVFVWISTI